MEHLLAPFKWFDTLVQKGVDNAAFFLMRKFGWRKSFIRYGLYAISIIGAAGALLYSLRNGKTGGIFMMSILILICVPAQTGDYAADKQAEDEPGTMSSADLNFLRKSWLMKPIGWYMVSLETLGFLYLGVNLFRLGWSMIWVGMLLNLYLAKTPSEPPVQKETVLEPVKQSA